MLTPPSVHNSIKGVAWKGLQVIVLSLSFTGILSAQGTASPIVVAEAKHVDGIASSFTLTGTVTSPRRANLSSRIEGLVLELSVDAGSLVKQGDVLMQLDTTLAELDLELIDAEIEQAKVQLADTKRLVAEAVRMSRSGAFAKSEAETRQATLQINEANLKQLAARKNQQLERLARHQLIAPFDGVIGTKLSEAGEWVATGTPVVELIEMDKLRFDIQVPQEYLARVNHTGNIVVQLDAYPNKQITAALQAVVPVKNNISRTFLIRLILNDPDQLAGPGMSGSATLESRLPSIDIVHVPRDAVVRFPDGSTKVWVLVKKQDQQHVVSRIVRTSGALGSMAEITEGLEGGEIVVLKGNEGLRENQLVDVLPTTAASQSAH